MDDGLASQEIAVSCRSGAQALKPVLPPLPFRFQPVRYADITESRRLNYGDHPVTRRRPRGATPAQRSGLRYQRQVCDELRKLAPRSELLVGPWLEYARGLGRNYCQPDALLFYFDLVYIFEIKLSSTTDAWWQLRHLYEPVVRHLYPDKRPVLVNVVKSYYPEIRFPDTWPFMIGLDRLQSQTAPAVVVQWKLGA